MTKRDPVFLNQYLKAIEGKKNRSCFHISNNATGCYGMCQYHEALDGAVVRVHEQRPQRADLSCSVPAIWAMNQDAGAFPRHSLDSPRKEEQQSLEKRNNIQDNVWRCIKTQTKKEKDLGEKDGCIDNGFDMTQPTTTL